MIWQTVVQPIIRHQVQSAVRQEKIQWEDFAQLMRVNEDLFPSCMAKVDNENKCVKSEELKSIDSGVQLLAEEPGRQARHEEKLDFERSSAEELAITQKLVRVGNKEIYPDWLVLEELNKIYIDEPSGDYRYEYFQGKNSRYIKECRQSGSMYRLVGENLGKYIILTGKANIVILTRVLAVIFTKYNRGFCLCLWDPGGRSYECSSDHHPMIRCTFQSAKR